MLGGVPVTEPNGYLVLYCYTYYLPQGMFGNGAQGVVVRQSCEVRALQVRRALPHLETLGRIFIQGYYQLPCVMGIKRPCLLMGYSAFELFDRVGEASLKQGQPQRAYEGHVSKQWHHERPLVHCNFVRNLHILLEAKEQSQHDMAKVLISRKYSMKSLQTSTRQYANFHWSTVASFHSRLGFGPLMI
ncbi:hypothetical protein VNO77_23363 [Canavalia gladiata]|uniref:Uncharacterized protein n=1 Tax=Canavalia gladiata TaxID=3824 RepID=A0AAN9L9I7_CANGL